MKRKLYVTVMTIGISLLMYGTALAAGWQQNESGWYYENADGSQSKGIWQWIDGNGDGISECYYFDEQGYALLDTVTPDGYIVDSSGAWTIDGMIQTKTAERAPTSKEIVSYLENRIDGITSLAIDTSRPEVASGATNIYYKNDYNSEKDLYCKNIWKWLMYKNNGGEAFFCPIAFNEEGYMLVNTITPDGYYVDQYGVLTINGRQVYHSSLCNAFPYWQDLIDKDGNIVLDKNNCNLENININATQYTMGGANGHYIPWNKLVYNHCNYSSKIDHLVHFELGYGSDCVLEANRPGTRN